MGDNHTDGRTEDGSAQKKNTGSPQEVHSLTWGKGLTAVFALFSLVAGLSGHWREWWVIVFILVALFCLAFVVHDLTIYRMSSDSALLMAFMLPLIIGVVIGFAYIVTWNTGDTGALSAPIISLEPGPIIDPNNPFDSAFTLQNTDPSNSIYHVGHLVWWNDPDSPGKGMILEMIFTNDIDELAPKMKIDLGVKSGPGYPARLGDRASFGMEVWYRREERQVTNRYRFQIANRNGKFTWLRRGSGDAKESVLDKIMKGPLPTKSWEIVPLVQTEIKSFKRVPQKTGEKPTLELVYILHNAGGFVAQKIEYMWICITLNGQPIYGFPVQEVFNGDQSVLWPDATVTNTIRLTDVDPPIYDDLIKSNLIMGGIVSYQDTGEIKYWTAFKIVYYRTNETWETRLLNFSPSLKAAGFEDSK